MLAAPLLLPSAVPPWAPNRRRLHPNYRLNRLLRGNLRLFGGAERSHLHTLAGGQRSYLLRHWPRLGVKDAQKRELVARSAAGDVQLEPLRLGEWVAVVQPPSLAGSRALGVLWHVGKYGVPPGCHLIPSPALPAAPAFWGRLR